MGETRPRAAARAVGYEGAGYGRVPALERRVLLPRDEHAPAGRAPDHGDGHRTYDLVREQIRIAVRESDLGYGQGGHRRCAGTSIEVRINAEDPHERVPALDRQRCATLRTPERPRGCGSTRRCTRGLEVGHDLRPDARPSWWSGVRTRERGDRPRMIRALRGAERGGRAGRARRRRWRCCEQEALRASGDYDTHFLEGLSLKRSDASYESPGGRNAAAVFRHTEGDAPMLWRTKRGGRRPSWRACAVGPSSSSDFGEPRRRATGRWTL